MFTKVSKSGAVFDQFEIMGGLQSMEKWRLAKLAQNDRIHFTKAGYELIGKLLFNAIFATHLNHN